MGMSLQLQYLISQHSGRILNYRIRSLQKNRLQPKSKWLRIAHGIIIVNTLIDHHSSGPPHICALHCRHDAECVVDKWLSRVARTGETRCKALGWLFYSNSYDSGEYYLLRSTHRFITYTYIMCSAFQSCIYILVQREWEYINLHT